MTTSASSGSGDEGAQPSEARTRFLAVAQHKLKTPLAVIAGWSATLQDWEQLDPEERTIGLDAISRSAFELQAQIDDLLDEARAHLLEQSIQLVRVDPAPLLEEQVRALRFDQARHPIDVQVEAGIEAVADEAALRQVMAHLFDNAVKYSPDGGAIEVSTRRDGDRCVISVRDHGIGLPEEVDVFEAFQRGHTAGGVARGTGLGLYIVRSLVSSMHGDVDASNLGDGTLIGVSLPAA